MIRLRCFCKADPGKLLWCSGSVHCLGAWSWSQGSSTPSGPASPMSGLQGRPGEQVTLMISQGLHRVEVGRGRSVSAGPLASVSTGRRYEDTPIKYESAVSANRKNCPHFCHILCLFSSSRRDRHLLSSLDGCCLMLLWSCQDCSVPQTQTFSIVYIK